MTRPSTRRALFVALGVALGGTHAESSSACGGPCDVGDVWSAAWVGDQLNVVTNFGLLRRLQSGWHLDCEEVFGDKLTAAHYSGSVQVALTASGFWVRDRGICSWQSHIDGASNSWFLGFALSEGGVADAGISGPVLVGLSIDRSTSDSKLEAASLRDDFQTLGTFSWELGLDRMVAGGVPARVYATGYSFPPRTWHVRTALLDTALSAPADVEFDGADIEREGELAELRPLAVDPRDSTRLWLRSAVTIQEPDALWSFDLDTQTLEQVFVLDRQEKLADIAFFDDRMFVAGRDEGVSVIYATALDALEFEPVATLDATLTCLEIDAHGWVVCNSDFTRESPFIVASSQDEGDSWEPELQIADLQTLSSCGEVCAATTGWLFGVYGAEQGGPSSSGERDFDIGGQTSEPEPEDDAGRPRKEAAPTGASDSGCGCRLYPASSSRRTVASRGALLLALLLPIGLRRRGSTRRTRPLDCAR